MVSETCRIKGRIERCGYARDRWVGLVLSRYVICVIGLGWRELIRLLYGVSYVGLENVGFVSLRRECRSRSFMTVNAVMYICCGSSIVGFVVVCCVVYV